MLLGSLVMFGCGLWDDVQPLRPATKLLWQLVAASLFVQAGGNFPLTHVQV
jgi:UDP-N-acetylmuramyl pentapeptide phosphotransferase/UDP-N-acetylglucosamine-1-phosphate transferase